MVSKKLLLISICSVLFIAFMSSFICALSFNYTAAYAPPYNVFENNKTSFSITPEYFNTAGQAYINVDVNVTLLGGYILKRAYYSDSVRGQWVQFNFSEQTVGNSSWIINRVLKRISIPASALANGQGNGIIIYSCKKYNGEWKCGCDTPKGPCDQWQIQTFNVSGSVNNPCTSNPNSCSSGKRCIDGMCVGSSGEVNPPTGRGTTVNPYIITVPEQIELIGNNLTANYVLANDVDASGIDFQPIVSFKGTFDGQNHVISGLHINGTSTQSIGLFKSIEYGAVIKNIGLTNVDFKIPSNSLYGIVGGIVAENFGGLIKDSYVTGSLSGGQVSTGGIVGINRLVVLTGPSGEAICNDNPGSCWKEGSSYVMRNSTLSNCYSNVNVNGTNFVGGLVGINEGFIKNSYSRGNVTSVSYGGGLTGGDGSNGYYSSTNSYYDVNNTNVTCKASCSSEAKIYWEYLTNRSYLESKSWDFTNTWQISSSKNNGYPYLKWQNL